MGIECNYIRSTWTGVSLQRYRKLIDLLTECFSSQKEINYAMTLLLANVWGKSSSKRSLLNFLLAFEESSGEGIFHENHSELRTEDSCERNNWLHSSFHDNTFSKEAISRTLNMALSDLRESEAVESERLGECYEIICASIARERAVKPAIKLSRYGHAGGDSRPDCVEVVVREVLEGLIFGMCDSFNSKAVHFIYY